METREYTNPTVFAEDMRLIFTNCYRYNAPDSDVVIMAKKLQDVFEMKYAKMPEQADGSYDNGMKTDSDSSSEEESPSEDDDSEEEREIKIKDMQDKVCFGIQNMFCFISC